MKHIKQWMLLVCIGLLFACQPTQKYDLVVGTISGPETDLVKVAQKVAKEQYGLNVKVLEFTDYHFPNEALADGTLDMNIYQHLPFLKASIKAKSYPIEAIGKTFIYPMGMYSKKYKSVTELPKNAAIAIPNDPSNETRALLLLEQAGLITLSKKDIMTPQNIVSNPKNLQIKELDSAQLPRILPDVAAAVINTTFAIPAGLVPGKDSIYLESKNSPYANLIVVKINHQKKQEIKHFIDAMHSQPVIDKANELFGTGAIAAW